MSDIRTPRLVVAEPFPDRVLDAVQVLRTSVSLVHLQEREKRPLGQNWQHGLSPEAIDRAFRATSNVGLLLGPASGGLVDIDLDCDEAARLAPLVLPPTVIFGRESRPGSHYLYHLEGPWPELRREVFQQAPPSVSPSGAKAKGPMLLEVRGQGHQTMCPPSVHPSGEVVRFERSGEVALVAWPEIQRQVRLLATVTLLAREWPTVSGSRHMLGLAVHAGLCRFGVDSGLARTLVMEIARVAGDEEADQRGDDPTRMEGRLLSDQPTFGWPTVAELLGERGQGVVSSVVRWLELGDDACRLVLAPLLKGRSVEQVLKAAPSLAKLPPAEYASARIQLRREIPGLNLNDLERAVNESRGDVEMPDTGMPTVEIGPHRPPRQVSAETERYLLEANATAASFPTLYRQESQIVEVTEDDDGRASTRRVTPERLRHLIDQQIDFVERRSRGARFVPVPSLVVEDLLHTMPRQLPQLDFVASVPIVRKDGSILSAPGYDLASRVLMLPSGAAESVRCFEKSLPSNAVARAKAFLLDDLLGDFPFEDEASRTHAVALLLTPLLREFVPAPYPFALIDATKQGTGKGLFTDVISVVATGAIAPKMTLPQEESEVRKRITSSLLSGPTLAVFDNVDRIIRSASLENLLTTPIWSDRLLGASEQVALRNQTMWVATGNNLTPGGDLPRRSILVRLDARTSSPNERSGFRHADLLGWVCTNRSRIVTALLVLVHAWIEAGRPTDGVPRMGSYQQWADAVGGILSHAGIGTILGNREKLHLVNDEDGEWEAFLGAVELCWGPSSFQIKELVGLLEGTADDLPFGVGGGKRSQHAWQVRDTVPAGIMATAKMPGKTLTTVLTAAVRSRNGTRFGERNLRLVKGDKTKNGSAVWHVAADAPALPS